MRERPWPVPSPPPTPHPPHTCPPETVQAWGRDTRQRANAGLILGQWPTLHMHLIDILTNIGWFNVSCLLGWPEIQGGGSICRLKRWPNIKPTLGLRIVFVWRSAWPTHTSVCIILIVVGQRRRRSATVESMLSILNHNGSILISTCYVIGFIYKNIYNNRVNMQS